jgi:hypothetical protein
MALRKVAPKPPPEASEGPPAALSISAGNMRNEDMGLPMTPLIPKTKTD